MFEREQLKLPTLGLLRRYLLANNWKSQLLRNGRIELFTLGDGEESPEIVLANVDPEDTEKRILVALQILSEITERAVEELARTISMLDFDVVQARLPNSLVLRDSIPLRIAEKFVGNARKFFVSAAAAQISGLVHVANPVSIGGEYADSCRFAHTFRGSFGFSIESPAGTSPSTLDGEPSPRPVERRIVERMALGLSHLQKASAIRSAEPIIEGAPDGFNVNMLEDFQAMLANSSASNMRFDFRLTPAWPTSVGQYLSASIQDDVLPYVETAASHLRPANVPQAEVIAGKIVWLGSREVPTDLVHEGGREIRVEGQSADRGALAVIARISSEDYLAAIDAHKNGRLVRLVGVVKRTTRGNSIAGIAEFSVI